MNKVIRVKEYAMPGQRTEYVKIRRGRAEGSFWHKIIVISFFIVIFGMLALRIALPAPTISMAENRELKKMPPFNFQNIFFGKFTTEFEDYFADTFPLRDPLMNAGEYVSYLYKIPVSGVDSIVIANDNMMQEDDIGDDEFEDNDFPISTGSQPPSSAVDFPAETAAALPLAGEAPTPAPQPTIGPQEQKGTFLLTDTAIYKELALDPATCSKWAQGVNRLAGALPDKRVMAMSVPNSFTFYADPKYFKPENDEKAGIADLYGQLDESVISIDPIPLLEQHKGEYIYFRTDLHWTARGAYCGYLALCEKTGMIPLPLDKFQQKAFSPDFLGSYYLQVKKSAKAKIIKESPDYIEYFVPPAECTVIRYNNASLKGGSKGSMFYTSVKAKPTYYYLFFGDDFPCMKITTDTENGRSLLILKDSYANALVPFLVAHYQTIYVIDYRDYNTSKLPKFKAADFVKKNNVDDILCIMNFDFMNVSNKAGWYLKAMP